MTESVDAARRGAASSSTGAGKGPKVVHKDGHAISDITTETRKAPKTKEVSYHHGKSKNVKRAWAALSVVLLAGIVAAIVAPLVIKK